MEMNGTLITPWFEISPLSAAIQGTLVCSLRSGTGRNKNDALLRNYVGLCGLMILLFLAPIPGVNAQSFHFDNYSVDDGLPSNEVYEVLQDSRGFIWFATDKGVARFDGYGFQKFTTEDGLHDNVIFYMQEDDRRRIWFSGLGDRFSYYDLIADTIISVPIARAGREPMSYDKPLYRIWQDTIAIMYSTYGMVFRLAGDSVREIRRIELFPDTGISRLIQQKTKVLHFRDIRPTTDANGLYLEAALQAPVDTFVRFTRVDQRTKLRTFLLSLGDSLALLQVYPNTFLLEGNRAVTIPAAIPLYSVLRDRDGRIWLGGEKGLLTMKRLPPYDISYVPSFEGKSITSMTRDHQDGIWFCTRQSGVYYLKKQPFRYYTRENGLARDAVKLLRCRDNTVVASYIDNAILSFFDTTGIEHISHSESREIGGLFAVSDSTWLSFRAISGVSVIKNRKVIQTLKTKHSPVFFNPKDNYLWRLGDQRCAYWDGERLHVTENPTNETYVVPGEIMCLFHDTLFNGGVFGLGCSTQPGNWKKIPLQGGLEVRINDLDAYKDHYMVAATMGAGVMVRQKNGKQRFLTTDHGLITNVCNNVYVDEEGDIWVGSNAGLCRIQVDTADIHRSRISRITRSSGLSSDQVNDVVRVNNRHVWVATSRGICVLDLTDTMNREVKNPLFLSGVGGTYGELSSLDSEEIYVPYDENLSFHFVGLDYQKQGQIAYEYRMAGLDTLWYETYNRTIRFPKIPDGNYEFQVRMKEMPYQVAKLAFIVDTPFWKAWWFWSLVVVTATALVHYRIRMVKEHARLSMKLAEVRQQALTAQINPHFLFNTMNSIRSYILMNQQDKAGHYLVKISQMMRAVLDNSFKKTITLQQELDMLEHYMEIEQIRSGDGFEYSIRLAPDVRANEISIPPSVLQPFVENAVWHGLQGLKDRKGRILIRCYHREKDLVVEITDNGRGFDTGQSEYKSGSHGMKITRERLALLRELHRQRVEVQVTSSTEPGSSGTCVRLVFSADG